MVQAHLEAPFKGFCTKGVTRLLLVTLFSFIYAQCAAGAGLTYDCDMAGEKFFEGSLFGADGCGNGLDGGALPSAAVLSAADDAAGVAADFTDLFDRLSRSKFRSSFHLSQKDRDYVLARDMNVIRRHAADFVRMRLAPSVIPNDGRQTPFRGHPVFRAQHATGCCCRGCFEKWHGVSKGKQLSEAEQRYAVDVIMEWIGREMA